MNRRPASRRVAVWCALFGALAAARGADFAAFHAKRPWTVSRELIAKGVPGAVPETIIDEALVPGFALPELLVTNAGRAVASAEEWERTRRGELLAWFQSEVFGLAPPAPERLRAEIVARDPAALGGQADVRRIAFHLRLRDETFTFHATLAVPARRADRAPVFLFLNYRGRSDIDAKRDAPSGAWPVAYGLARGYAMAALDLAAEVEPDAPDAATGLRAFYRRNHPRPDELTWGAVAAWAWAASRVVDFLVAAPDIDAARIAIIGHSRAGKTALWAGAQDPRIALVAPNNAGAAGPALARRRFGNTIEVMTGRNPHWFTAKYAAYARRENILPVDQHMLVALVAPRGYHGGDGAEDLWHDPRGSWLALVEASRAWALHGKAEPLPDRMPWVNDLLRRGPLAYHLRAGGHGLLAFDWKLYFDHADGLFSAQ